MPQPDYEFGSGILKQLRQSSPSCDHNLGFTPRLLEVLLAFSKTSCYAYYVTRSTHDVASQDPNLGRYSDPPLLVMTSLADGPKHGHAMIEDIVRMSGTRLGPGTLYGAIARLEREKLIEPLPVEERRQPYRLTAKGLRVLRAKLATLHGFARAGLRKLEAR
jgi:DNA-binding PadR family transcriptional regulator